MVRIINWQFKPGLWPSVAVVLLLPLLLYLGFWQLDRAEQKAARQQQYQSRSSAAALDLNQAYSSLSKTAAEWRPGIGRGRFDMDTIFLLDNQVMARQAGYFVYGVFSLANEKHKILVNYGWVPVGSDRRRPPDIVLPVGELLLKGRIKKAPATGIKLAATEEENLDKGVYRIQALDLSALAGNRGWRLLPYVLRLPPPGPSGFLRHWAKPGFGQERHLGYAFQWFALAGALVIIYLVVNLQRVKHLDGD